MKRQMLCLSSIYLTLHQHLLVGENLRGIFEMLNLLHLAYLYSAPNSDCALNDEMPAKM